MRARGGSYTGETPIVAVLEDSQIRKSSQEEEPQAYTWLHPGAVSTETGGGSSNYWES